MSVRRSSRLLAKASTAATETVPPAIPKVNASPNKVTKTRQKKAASSKKPKPPAASPRADKGKKTAVETKVAATSSASFVSLADPGMFDAALAHLKQADPKLAALIDRTKEPCSMSLDRGRIGNTSYTSLCRSIIYQQLAGKAAAAILLKFLKRYGKLKDASKAHLLDADNSELEHEDFVFPPPEQVAELDVAEMKAVGLGQRKAEYLKEVAKRFKDGTLSDDLLAAMSDEEVSSALVSIRGIGQWTADMFLMFHLKRPNVLPTLDLAVRKSMCQHFGAKFGKNTPTHDELVEMGRVWEPYRSVATWYMWRLSDTVVQKQ